MGHWPQSMITRGCNNSNNNNNNGKFFLFCFFRAVDVVVAVVVVARRLQNNNLSAKSRRASRDLLYVLCAGCSLDSPVLRSPRTAIGCLIAGQLGEGGVHLVGEGLVSVLVETQLVCKT